jgi:hypothetical protein
MTKPLSEMTVDELYDFILIATKYAPSHESVDALNSWHELARRLEECQEKLASIECDGKIKALMKLEEAENRYAEFREWYDLDGSVGGLSQLIERHDAAMAKDIP